MWVTMRAIWSILAPEHRRAYRVFMVALFLSSLLELVAVSSVALFMKRLSQAHDLADRFPVGPISLNLTELAFVAVALFATSNIVIAYCTYTLAHFTWNVESNLSRRVLVKILSNPQAALNGRNSGQIFNDIWCSALCQKGIRLSLLGWAPRIEHDHARFGSSVGQLLRHLDGGSHTGRHLLCNSRVS